MKIYEIERDHNNVTYEWNLSRNTLVKFIIFAKLVLLSFDSVYALKTTTTTKYIITL